MTHTPGNWTDGEARKNEFNIWQSKVLRRFAPLARIVGMAYGNNEIEAQSNAKLMAAAPELLQTLIDLKISLSEDGYDSSEEMTAIDEAIKKATT